VSQSVREWSRKKHDDDAKKKAMDNTRVGDGKKKFHQDEFFCCK